MISRCANPNKSSYPEYGGRGIAVCERWSDFRNFLADMGEKPANLSLDRIDVNGNYEPGNCRWATHSEQVRNRRPYTLSPEHRARLSEVNRGRMPVEAIAANRHRVWTAETRAKISAVHRGKTLSPQTIAKRTATFKANRLARLSEAA